MEIVCLIGALAPLVSLAACAAGTGPSLCDFERLTYFKPGASPMDAPARRIELASGRYARPPREDLSLDGAWELRLQDGRVIPSEVPGSVYNVRTSLSLERIDATHCRIRNTGPVAAVGVRLEAGESADKARLEDNFFFLDAGESRTLSVSPDAELTSACALNADILHPDRAVGKWYNTRHGKARDRHLHIREAPQRGVYLR